MSSGRYALEAWRAVSGTTEIVLARNTQAPRGTIRAPLTLDQLAEIDLDAHDLFERDGHCSARHAAPLFVRRARALLTDDARTPRRLREHVEIARPGAA